MSETSSLTRRLVAFLLLNEPANGVTSDSASAEDAVDLGTGGCLLKISPWRFGKAVAVVSAKAARCC